MYSPKIPERLIPALYRLGRDRGRPMTYLVAEAIERYLATEEPVSDDQLKAISATAHGRASDPRVAA